MFACFKDGEFFGVRCEDHGVAWRDWFLSKYEGVSAGLHDPRDGDNEGLCVECVGEITGELVILDRECAVYVWEGLRGTVGNDLPFAEWIRDPHVRQQYVWQYEDDAWSIGATFTQDECDLIRVMLLDVSLALTIAGDKLPYDVEVFSSIVNKLADAKQKNKEVR